MLRRQVDMRHRARATCTFNLSRLGARDVLSRVISKCKRVIQSITRVGGDWRDVVSPTTPLSQAEIFLLSLALSHAQGIFDTYTSIPTPFPTRRQWEAPIARFKLRGYFLMFIFAPFIGYWNIEKHWYFTFFCWHEYNPDETWRCWALKLPTFVLLFIFFFHKCNVW